MRFPIFARALCASRMAWGVMVLADTPIGVPEERVERSVKRLDFFRLRAEHEPHRAADASDIVHPDDFYGPKRIVGFVLSDMESEVASKRPAERDDVGGEIAAIFRHVPAQPLCACTEPKP